MKLNRKELRIIQYDFNSYSNRLLQADYDDYADVLRKFVNYIDNIPIISDYIHDCGSCDWDLENEIKEVQGSYGRLIFSLGKTESEEIRNVYAVLKYLAKKKTLKREPFNWLGRKDSNLRDGWTKTSCLTTWRRPIAITIIEYQDYMSRGFIFNTKKYSRLWSTFT